ncbi:MAG TPA: DUF4038 domain-containing protein [Myxococcales bacterium]|nr:DUF4038 domain-containing protein [Myxococcales bacterium]
MRGALAAGLAIVVAAGEAFAIDARAYAYPLKASANGRYLVDQDGKPFLLIGDSAQSAAVNLTAGEVEVYLADRAAKGFSAINLNVIEHQFARGGKGATLSGVPTNRAGQLPFTKDAAGGAYDGTFGTADFGSPNDAYFAFVERVVDRAAAHGILVTLAYPYTGYSGSQQGWWSELTNSANTAAKCRAFGQYLATGNPAGGFNGFKDKANVIWVVGGDRFPGSDPAPESAETRLLAVLQGLRSAGAMQLHTADWDAPDIVHDEPRFLPYFGVNAIYSYGEPHKNGHTYATARRGYAATPVLPGFLRETGYESEKWIDGSPPSLRKYHWWALLSGATTGVIYGHRDVWGFATASWNPRFFSGYADWRDSLSSTGALDMRRMAVLLNGIPWYRLVPSELAGMKKLVTSANGTQGRDDYVAAAASPDGSLLVAYVPPSGGTAPQGVVIDMTAMAGPSRARWWSPTTGEFALSSASLPNTGTHAFTTPGNNGARSNDWLLLLDPAGRADGSSPGSAASMAPSSCGCRQAPLGAGMFLVPFLARRAARHPSLRAAERAGRAARRSTAGLSPRRNVP